MTYSKPRIHIVGAGFSGLSVAYLLAKSQKFDISIFEKNDQVGGMISSSYKDGFLVEKAANSILCTDEIIQFLDEIGAHYVTPLKTAKKRFFYRESITRWPLNLAETLYLIPRIVFHLLTRKKFISFKLNETVAHWSHRYLGKSFTKYILSPGLQGIYAISADHLDAKTLLGSLLERKKEKYKGIVSGKKGMLDLIHTLEKNTLNLGVKILKNQTYDFSLPSEIVILATSAKDAAQTLMLKDQIWAAEIKKIQTNHIMTVTCRIKSTQRPQGFGCLISENNETKCLGVLFNSDIFENRTQNYEISETYIFSRSEAEKINQFNPDELKSYMDETRKIILKENQQIEEIFTTYWPEGLPIYNHILADFQNKHAQPKNNIYLHGNYVAGIGLSKIFKNSIHIANSIIKDQL